MIASDVVVALSAAFAHAAPWQFIEASQVIPALAGAKAAHFVLLKVSQPIVAHNALIAPESTKLPLCRLHYLYSAGLLFAYLVEIPRYVLNIRANFISVLRPGSSNVTAFTESKVVLQNQHLTIFHSEDGACLVTLNERFNYLSPDLLRGSSTS